MMTLWEDDDNGDMTEGKNKSDSSGVSRGILYMHNAAGTTENRHGPDRETDGDGGRWQKGVRTLGCHREPTEVLVGSGPARC